MEKTSEKTSELFEQKPWSRWDTYGLAAVIILLLAGIALVVDKLWVWLPLIATGILLFGAAAGGLYLFLLWDRHHHTVRLPLRMAQDKHDLEMEMKRGRHLTHALIGEMKHDAIPETTTNAAPSTVEGEIAAFLGAAQEHTMPPLSRRNGTTNGTNHDVSAFDMDDGSAVDIGSEEARQVAELSLEGRDVSTISRQVFHVRGGSELTEANERVRAIQRELIANGLE